MTRAAVVKQATIQERPRSGISFWRRMERGPWIPMQMVGAETSLAIDIDLFPEFEASVSRTAEIPADFVIAPALSAIAAAQFRAIPHVRADVGFIPRVSVVGRLNVHVDASRRLHSIRQERILRDILTEMIAR